jgi:hypothetical protein
MKELTTLWLILPGTRSPVSAKPRQPPINTADIFFIGHNFPGSMERAGCVNINTIYGSVDNKTAADLAGLCGQQQKKDHKKPEGGEDYQFFDNIVK